MRAGPRFAAVALTAAVQPARALERSSLLPFRRGGIDVDSARVGPTGDMTATAVETTSENGAYQARMCN
jgi:hypothetical protein